MTDAFHIDVPHTDGALAVIALSGEFEFPLPQPGDLCRVLEVPTLGAGREARRQAFSPGRPRPP
ncbi:hypothetical protein [Streptomyces sp. NBC_00459]|uniref:hypothetical protein n=1 Tax=Streptomyces sp. NBC_00459 TaxID=2975749 RepID=UPI002E1981BB